LEKPGHHGNGSSKPVINHDAIHEAETRRRAAVFESWAGVVAADHDAMAKMCDRGFLTKELVALASQNDEFA
jgi:hypothetical protein